jgi:hypothetical protein
MKIIQLLTLFVLISLQAGAAGYSHNMFVAQKKLHQGKERRAVTEQVITKKACATKLQPSVSAVSQDRSRAISLTGSLARLSGIVTLNQPTPKNGSSALFFIDDEEENKNSLVTGMVGAVKGFVFAFIRSISLGRE